MKSSTVARSWVLESCQSIFVVLQFSDYLKQLSGDMSSGATKSQICSKCTFFPGTIDLPLERLFEWIQKLGSLFAIELSIFIFRFGLDMLQTIHNSTGSGLSLERITKNHSTLPETMTFAIGSRPLVADGDQIWEQIWKLQQKLNNLAFEKRKASETAKLRL